ncbi:MAG TPA: TolC family protein [Gemmatimonadales bacterium]|nr:TolC family protein [Gemmatimonadales bacterium]
MAAPDSRVMVLLGICLFGGVGPAVAQKPKLTLAEAVARANRVQPGVVSAGGSVRNAQARQRSASGAYLPNLTLTGSRGDNFSEGSILDPSTGQLTTNGTSTRSVGTTLNSSVDLFAGFRRSGEKKAAGANRDAAEASFQNAQFQQQLTTTNTFFDVLAAEQLMLVRTASVRRAEEQLKVAVAKLQAGRGIRPDSLRSLVTLGNAQLQLVNAQTALATAEANLGRLVGEDGPVGAVDDSTLYQTLPAADTAALRTEALANSPAVKSAEASAASARAAITVAKAGYYPTLNLSGSASYNGSSRNSYTFLQSRQVTLGLNWPIFNRFQREQGIVSSQVAAEVADASASEAHRQVLASLTAALAALEAARLRIGISQTSVAAGQEDLRVQQERYRLGVATIVDVLTSQEALSQAEVDGVTARFDYVRARAQISALIGRTL